MDEKTTIAAEKMLRILREHNRIVEHYNEPEEMVPLRLNSEDMCAARVYTHEEVNQLREHFVTDTPHVPGKLPVYFWKQDISEHLYKCAFNEWEYTNKGGYFAASDGLYNIANNTTIRNNYFRDEVELYWMEDAK